MSPSDLPPLENFGPPASAFEFMPAWRFYLPLAPHILRLALRYGPATLTAANPAIPAGGLVGESKTKTLDLVSGPARDLIAPYLRLARTSHSTLPANVAKKMDAAGVSFPAVAKPDMSCRGAGVRTIDHMEALADYWTSFPVGADLVLQSRIMMEPEAGIFYIREPGSDTPTIFSLTLKYTPSVTGDGTSTLRQLILQNARAALTADVYFAKPNLNCDRVPARGERITLSFAGNHCRGSVFRNGAEFITPELTHSVDEIMRALPDFYFGRMDVRFESLAKLKDGEGYKIIEINGVGSEATHVWDNRFTLGAARKVLKQQFTHAYEIGAMMKARGSKPTPLLELLGMWLTERRLTAKYPVSD